MAEKKETMDSSGFKRLAERFSRCRSYVDEKVKVEPIERVMDDAGKALFYAISSGRVCFDLTPIWLKREPKSIEILRDPHGEGAEVEVCGWNLYWAFAANWLHRNKCGHKNEPRGLIFWPDAGHYLGGHSVRQYLVTIKHVKPDSNLWKQVWQDLIRTSEDVCLYLADMLANKPVPAETKQRPVCSKFTKIRGWTKGLVEKGWQIFTKSFWEALFDRVWPK